MYDVTFEDYMFEFVFGPISFLLSIALLSVIAFFVYKKGNILGIVADCAIVILVFVAVVPRLVMINLPFLLIVILTFAAEAFIFYLFLNVIANLKLKQRSEDRVDAWFQKQKNDNNSNDDKIE